ncbi:MAG: hypothetical protein LBS88_04220 [Tannerellaceae bacterium]|nr:hypothetical protein [Tannerellaceae bacterium]
MINMLQDGEYVLAITKRTKRRTLASNRLFWLWMACIEMETGTPKEDAHDYYCSLFLRRHVMFNGVEKEVISGTSTLNTVQFSDFLKKIQADADTELGITLPDPEAAYWEEFERYYSQFV